MSCRKSLFGNRKGHFFEQEYAAWRLHHTVARDLFGSNRGCHGGGEKPNDGCFRTQSLVYKWKRLKKKGPKCGGSQHLLLPGVACIGFLRICFRYDRYSRCGVSSVEFSSRSDLEFGIVVRILGALCGMWGNSSSVKRFCFPLIHYSSFFGR